MTPRGNEVERVGGPLAPGDTLNLPLFAIHSPTAELFFRVEKSTVSIVPFVWKELQRISTFSSVLRCDPKEGGSPVFIQVIGETERLPHERTGKHTLSSVCHSVYLRPTVILRNLLPLDIVVTQSGISGETTVASGNHLNLPSACPGSCSLVIKLPNYLEREWSCLEDVRLNQPELTVWSFESHDAMKGATLDLGMHGGKTKGTLELSLFAPCWMINKTGFLLTYRAADDSSNTLYHPPDLNGPVLFGSKGKAFFGKKKALVRIENSEWSTNFSLDAVGSSGVVSCSTPTLTRQLGVHVQLTGCSLTKRVIFMPRVVLVNSGNLDLECREEGRSADPWIYIPAGECCPFWPHDVNGKLEVQVAGTSQPTAPFPIGLITPMLLPLSNRYGGLEVESQNTEGATYITFRPYKPGFAPALIINHHHKGIDLWEKGSKNVWTLMPNEQRQFSWSDPSGARLLCWKGRNGKEVSTGLTEDDLGEIGDRENGGSYWVTFLDGMQRILLFTDDVALAQDARTAGELEAASMNLSVSFHGLGFSLVDDSKAVEVLHAGIAR
ncbi:hypothetical protein J437_LFUL009198 [Ladona fulva]|uniref:Vacuolar protein sorting-associated protein 13 VPS13 adaptor binding domain-containing protein n=1 Tax=Ladona fulva TaxID=123851 RepID=A0A8K0K7U0_LADFU|nr:hypothetical protein J437_LFUL009198 [Ladona fulva]